MDEADRWREALHALRAEVETDLEAGAEGEATVELDQTRVGRVSRMDALQSQAMSAAANRRRRLMLTRIDAALERVAQDAFGTCIACGEPIAEARLTADPTVLRCIDCAEQGERN